MKISLRATLMTIFLAGALFFVTEPALAAVCPAQIVPQCDWEAGQTYGLGAFTEIVINILRLIWCIIGAIALAMFVIGGFWWLMARGEEQQIKQGWDTLINAFIGVVIVLGSWVIINTVILAVTSPGEWKIAEIFAGEQWSMVTASDTVCVGIAARRVGIVPIQEGEGELGAFIPSPAPPIPPPLPAAVPETVPAREFVYETQAQWRFNELVPWGEILTPPQGGSIPIDPNEGTSGIPIPSNNPARDQLIDILVSPDVLLSMAAFVPVGGPLLSMGGKIVISGARLIGSRISLSGAKVIVKGCSKTAEVCKVKAQDAITKFMNVQKGDLETIIRHYFPTPQSVPIRVRP